MDDVKRIEESTIQTEWYSARACLYHGLKLAVEKTKLKRLILLYFALSLLYGQSILNVK